MYCRHTVCWHLRLCYYTFDLFNFFEKGNISALQRSVSGPSTGTDLMGPEQNFVLIWVTDKIRMRQATATGWRKTLTIMPHQWWLDSARPDSVLDRITVGLKIWPGSFSHPVGLSVDFICGQMESPGFLCYIKGNSALACNHLEYTVLTNVLCSGWLLKDLKIFIWFDFIFIVTCSWVDKPV